MLDLEDYQPQERAEHFRAMAVCIVENFELEKSVDNIGLLNRLAHVISINAFTVQDYLFNYDGIAIGLYYPANYINHSCDPNAVQIFDGAKLRILALEDIDEGEEIFISYIDELNELKDRNKMLREAYLFDCSCFHCLAEKAVKAPGYDIICQACGKGDLKQKSTTQKYICSVCAK
jgi:hypothetical protein